MTADLGRRLLTTGAAARVLGVHRRTVERWCELGELPHVVIATRYRIPARALSAWLDGIEKRALSDAPRRSAVARRRARGAR